jgi:hypothetical protein
MTTTWSTIRQCYVFDTGILTGGIEPFTHYHGLCGLMHTDLKLNAVQIRKALLNAEYFVSPATGSSAQRRPLMVPRNISHARETVHSCDSTSVIISFPPEPEYETPMKLTYTPLGNSVDLLVELLPQRTLSGFEIFFASYVCEDFDETWVCLKDRGTVNMGGSPAWKRLNNREVINSVFRIPRDHSSALLAEDGRWGRDFPLLPKVDTGNAFFHHPVMVARNSRTGFALVFLLSPESTSTLAGQYHGWDTAHDWSFGFDLVKGRPERARARLTYTRIADSAEIGLVCEHLLKRFIEEEGSAPGAVLKEDGF